MIGGFEWTNKFMFHDSLLRGPTSDQASKCMVLGAIHDSPRHTHAYKRKGGGKSKPTRKFHGELDDSGWDSLSPE